MTDRLEQMLSRAIAAVEGKSRDRGTRGKGGTAGNVVSPKQNDGKDYVRLDVEVDSEQELKELENTFLSRLRAESDRFINVTDSEYWICICFQTREQREEFLRKTGWDSEDGKYIDGISVCKQLGIVLESPVPPVISTDRNSGKFDYLVDDLP